MKTNHIIRALRNSTAPQSKLAAWQSLHVSNRLRRIRERRSKDYHAGESLADARRALINQQGPELSSLESPEAYLWDPATLDEYPGRQFLSHRGWYCDQYQCDTLETYAVRLPEFPRLMFYAVKNSLGGSLRVHLEDWEEIDGDDTEAAARSIVRGCDSATEGQAEESREYYEAEDRKSRIEENRQALKNLRGEIRSLAAELKRLCPMAGEYPAAAAAVKRSLKRLLAERVDLMEENAKLAEA
jgi:hypothetical protein